MANITDAPPSVVDVLRDHILQIDGITQDRLASALGVSRHSVNELANDRRAVTASMALRLAKVLGTEPQFWMNLQRDIDLWLALKQADAEIEKLPVLRAPKTKSDVVVDFATLFAESE